ncbi:MAG: type II toxin-antitoxin system RelE/ParE family toxin [Clostridia bacterium]
MWDIEFYETQNDKVPVNEFLDSLNIKMKAKAFKDISILSEFGKDLREPYCKYIKDGVFELRIKFASDISRIFYFFYIDNKIILTNGFIKKTQKTPTNEISKALKYKADYERRAKNEEL